MNESLERIKVSITTAYTGRDKATVENNVKFVSARHK